MMSIRRLSPEDFPHASRIFFCAVHEGTRDVYSLQQRLAWAGETIDLAQWATRLRDLDGYVAEEHGEPVGFMTVDKTGFIDLAFVLPSCSRQGVGAKLLSVVERQVSVSGGTWMTTNASLASKPFFEKHSWVVIDEEEVSRNGSTLRRFKMRKKLSCR